MGAAVLVGGAAEVAGAEGAVGGVRVGVFVFAFGRAGVAARLPTIAAGEDVLDALVGGQLAWLARPRGGEGAAVEVLDVGGVARLGYAGDGWRVLTLDRTWMFQGEGGSRTSFILADFRGHEPGDAAKNGRRP